MIQLGIERLNEFDAIFQNKKIGLITNPTGVDSNLKSSIDMLHEKGLLHALFSPEHGVRGNIQAGVRLDDYTDELTNVVVYSLYGSTKEPTKEMLADLDIIAFDIQDVGARFYTYLNTLRYAMIASKKYDKQIVVFDRPNPVGGDLVEGWPLNPEFHSFVGYDHLLQRYGLTVGELALFMNDYYDINASLQVIPMLGYTRDMTYYDTSLPWVLPSPNLPTIDSTFVYLGTCIFEGTNISEGRGTTKPFSVVGSPFLQARAVLADLNKLNLPGVMFRTIYFTPTFSKHEGQMCNGIELIITDYQTFRPVRTGLYLLNSITQHDPEFRFLKPYKRGLHPMFDLLTGDDVIRTNKQSIQEVIHNMDEYEKAWIKIKRRYHLYETA